MSKHIDCPRAYFTPTRLNGQIEFSRTSKAPGVVYIRCFSKSYSVVKVYFYSEVCACTLTEIYKWTSNLVLYEWKNLMRYQEPWSSFATFYVSFSSYCNHIKAISFQLFVIDKNYNFRFHNSWTHCIMFKLLLLENKYLCLFPCNAMIITLC